MLAVFEGILLVFVYGLSFILCLLTKHHYWQLARSGALFALVTSVMFPVYQMYIDSISPFTLPSVMGLMVALLGYCIIDFASRYLEGDKGQARFVRAMLFTLFAVSIMVTSDNLLLMAVAWSATSLSLHILLTHYQERKAAQIVAHKKFLASRLADVCLIISLALIYQHFETFSLTSIYSQLDGIYILPPLVNMAVLMIVMAAIFKTAQMPLHGWLIQVMEAPTPVSALLHAGIVNMGGFMLISLAPLLNLAPIAQSTLVVIGGVTLLLAGLVMMTRVSIKVRLAWSTCAQMGFMLVEIGLGLYELALLHLIAHSAYKAYCFLSAGDTVARTLDKQYLIRTVSAKGAILALISTTTIVVTVLFFWQQWIASLTLPTTAVVVLTCGLSTLLWRTPAESFLSIVSSVFRITVLLHLYLVWHIAFSHISPENSITHGALVGFVIVCFCLLFIGQIVICRYRHTHAVKRFYPWVYHGFYLDETFTRITFHVWPLKLNGEQAQTQINRKKSLVGDVV